jgi:hypothetical protein
LATEDLQEEKQSCENCGAKWAVTYDTDQCDSSPEVCPFCGAAASSLDSQDEDDVYDGDEEDNYDESDED